MGIHTIVVDFHSPISRSINPGALSMSSEGDYFRGCIASLRISIFYELWRMCFDFFLMSLIYLGVVNTFYLVDDVQMCIQQFYFNFLLRSSFRFTTSFVR